MDEERELDDKAFYWKIRNYVEVYGFLFTIVGFVFFNLIYWPWILINSNYYNDNVDFNYNSRLE